MTEFILNVFSNQNTHILTLVGIVLSTTFNCLTFTFFFDCFTLIIVICLTWCFERLTFHENSS